MESEDINQKARRRDGTGALIQAYLLFQVMKELVPGAKKAIGLVKGVPEADSGMVSPPSPLMPSASVVRHRRHSGRVFEQTA